MNLNDIGDPGPRTRVRVTPRASNHRFLTIVNSKSARTSREKTQSAQFVSKIRENARQARGALYSGSDLYDINSCCFDNKTVEWVYDLI